MMGYMQAMEKLTDAKSKAIKTVLPALEAFYATLGTDQKAILDSKEGCSRFRRWHDPLWICRLRHMPAGRGASVGMKAQMHFVQDAGHGGAI